MTKNAETEAVENQRPLGSSSVAGANVSKWLKTATKPQKMAYMSAGEPQCIELTHRDKETGDFYTALYPALRGIMFSTRAETVEEALRIAKKTKDDILANEEIEPIDEEDLELTGEGQRLHNMSIEDDMNVESVLHVGTMLNSHSMSLRSDDILEDMEMEDLHKILKQVAGTLPAWVEDEKDEMDKDMFFELMSELGLYGFLLQVSVPVYERTGEHSMSSTGSRRLHSVYGDTYAKAVKRGIEWAKEENERMRAQPIAA